PEGRRAALPPGRPSAAALCTAGRRGPRGGTMGSPTTQSGCPDLNWGPLRPERSALPGCATPRAGYGYRLAARGRRRSLPRPRAPEYAEADRCLCGAGAVTRTHDVSTARRAATPERVGSRTPST